MEIRDLIQTVEMEPSGGQGMDGLIRDWFWQVAKIDSRSWAGEPHQRGYDPRDGEFTTSVDAAMLLLRSSLRPWVNFMEAPASANADWKATAHPLWTLQCDWRSGDDRPFAKTELTVPSREFQGRAMGANCEARSIVSAALLHYAHCDCAGHRKNPS